MRRFPVTYREVPCFSGPCVSSIAMCNVAFAKFGKTPSTKARISVQRERRSGLAFMGKRKDETSDLINLMVAIARRLPEEQFRELCEQLEEIWS